MNEEDISSSVNATVIKVHMSCKLLGVHIDDNLNLSKHFTSLCKKTSKQIAIISMFKKLLSTKTKLVQSLYFTSFYPLFHCMDVLWQNSSWKT